MPRTITTHIVNPANDHVGLMAFDEPGSGGAHHVYRLTIGHRLDSGQQFDLRFQDGPIAEAGVNGITHEVLLAIVQDRLECFQAGPYACHENAAALAAVKEAQRCLQMRTRARMARGVEGTSQK